MLNGTQPTSQAGLAVPRALRAHAIDCRHAASWPLYPYKQRYVLGSSPAGRCARRTGQRRGIATGAHDQRSRLRLLRGRCAHLADIELQRMPMPASNSLEEAAAPKSCVGPMVYYLLSALPGIRGVRLANNICSRPSPADALASSGSASPK